MGPVGAPTAHFTKATKFNAVLKTTKRKATHHPTLCAPLRARTASWHGARSQWSAQCGTTGRRGGVSAFVKRLRQPLARGDRIDHQAAQFDGALHHASHVRCALPRILVLSTNRASCHNHPSPISHKFPSPLQRDFLSFKIPSLPSILQGIF